MSTGPRICFLAEPPRSEGSTTFDLINELRSSGAEVDIVSGHLGLLDMGRLPFAHDLVLFKSHAPRCETLAAAATHLGMPVLNGYGPTMTVRDKVLTSTLLLAAGVPTPRTFVAGALDDLRDVVRTTPLVVKPPRGHRGEGIEICPDEATLEALIARAEPASDGVDGDGESAGADDVLAQELLEHEGFDYKAYAIGRDVHVVKRVFPARTKAEKLGERVAADDELVDLVHACGDITGLDLYGVDLVRTPTGYQVIEINCFPGFKGVPDAGRRMADHVLRAMARL